MATRTPISAGNWKMHLSNAEADALCDRLTGLADIDGVEVVLAPAFLQLARVRDRFRGSGLGIAGQNMHHDASGAYTGEVSPLQLREVADWVLLGHSERRQQACEDDSAVNRKVAAALAHGLRPILCVGERREERRAGRTEAVLTRQVQRALGGITVPPDFVIAYEPVWAIGSGEAASGEEAQAASFLIRTLITDLAGPPLADSLRILYGGSVTPHNIPDFAAQPDIDGALVGGASLDADAFLAITRAIAAAKRA